MFRTSSNDHVDWAVHGFTGNVDDLTAEGTLVHAWLNRWSESPDVAVICDPHTKWMTGAQLRDATTLIAGRLWHAGLRHGDRILMSCDPSVDLVIAHIAALRLGLIVVPVNTSFAPQELANILSESGAKLSVVDDASRLPTALQDGNVVSARIDLPDGVAPAVALDAVTGADPMMLVFTSGTTGKPKGALLSHANMLASAEALRIAWRWTPTDRLVLSLPLFHMHGLGVGVHGSLLSGASMVIVPKFSVDAVLDAARDHDATLFFGVPTMWVRLLASPRVGELASLRLCVSGSAPLAGEVMEALAEQAHQRIIERYGMTETAMNVSNPYNGDRRAGTVGLALPGVSVRLDMCTDDGVGEIVLRGPNVFSGYWERPDANAEAFTADGWFRTGDLGSIDSDGYVRIVGRSKDLIITGGFNVYPSDVEQVLRTHTAVADVAVAGEPSSEWGETVTAFVVVSAPVTAEALIEFAVAHLAPYQRPRRVVFLDELPRNALGKVVKAQLPR